MSRTLRLLMVCLLAINNVTAQEPAEATAQTADVTQEQRSATEKAVRKHFPGLDKDVLAGWVDAYAGLPASELEQLLLQKSLMPSTGANGLFADYTSEPEHPTTAAQHSFFTESRTILRNNILHAETPGFRRRMLNTMVTEPSADGDLSSIALTKPTFDFSPAERFVSYSPLHVALADKRGFGTMFRLEPGCILTRCGRFERLQDGKLGLKIGQQSLPLYGDIKIPADVSNVYIDTSGLVSSVTGAANGKKPSRIEYGQIQLAAIYDTSLLQSNNGVFFKVPAEEIGRSITMTSKVSLFSRSLERSNVDVQKELERLKRIDLLSR